MRRKKELIVVLSSLLIIVLSVSVAYFAAQIVGEGKQLSVNTANLRITYEESDGSLSGTNIAPPWSSSMTFKVTNSSNETYEYDIIIEDLVNTFVLNYLEYKITSTDGGYNMTEYKPVPKSASATNKVLAHSISIDEGDVHNYTIELRYVESDTDQSADMGKTLSGRIMISEGTTQMLTFMDQLLADNPTVYTVGGEGSPRANFATAYTAVNTNTLFTTNSTENGKSVYYFGGNAQNNWIKLATTTTRNACTIDGENYYKYIDEENKTRFFTSESECTSAVVCDYDYVLTDETVCIDLWGSEVTATGGTFNAGGVQTDALWRIIRTNEDGSIRLLYAGTGMGDAEYSFSSGINNNFGDIRNVSYMYGGDSDTVDLTILRKNTNDGPFKIEVDKFYQDIIGETYDKYVSKTAIYCHDRSLENGTTDFTSKIDFGGASRTRSRTPSYKCGSNTTGGLFESIQAVADKFSVSEVSGGNGDLTYPAALMTADEGIFAGNNDPWYTYGMNNKQYYGDFWTMTPSRNLHSSRAFQVTVIGTWIHYTLPGTSYPIIPVISLKSCVNYTDGNGSFADPYIVSVDATCAAAEN